jgi:PadR family transcriptional regulator, regulatory protein PadR
MATRSSHDPIPSGTLEMLVLTTLDRRGELHGFEIADAIESVSTNVLRVEEGSLYPALQRLLVKGWIAGEWRRTDENRRARYYRLTSAGRRELTRQVQTYQRVAGAIARILEMA